ncbi:hypothetical protein NDA11_007473 [Ustilago hordei]|uniref:Galactan 1,3-beta-galactosidase n=1 Tax=Ustilago hordei TaxID=120017 RepID=I2G0R1_USTHO|nr:uncharacterized protein UHO2_03183 [Ustilago hordei]KAJ1038576.1 hypothetical protein NDA10_007743 [Ustilago hordei]KAJ1581182.1 hypothetical protein NDA15_006057 [Ustilago hordei]KAJ1583008.1 hypothetical protein NDA12_007169 [Ustilago hordei]KAJ1588846.1 hypothetical protein NDA11_007473 [Ustilago hordei]UTT92558.1 hypothetical protein NDA17_000675 [Ustilago hordei]
MVRKTLLSSLSTLALTLISSVTATENYIVSGDRWHDTSSSYINAHGAGLLHDSSASLWYWVGEYKAASNGFQGFSLYSSSDLINWDSHGLILPPSSSLPFQVGERPKLIKNSSTGEYVLWFHADSSNYSLAKVGICYANKVTGPYTCPENGVFSPLGMESRDMNVYVDTYNNNQGYLLFATNGNADVGIAKMTSDYKNLTSLVGTIASRLEGFGVFRDDAGLYNMVVSNQSGWQPNANSLYTTPNLGTQVPTYSNYIANNAYNTYNSQNTFEISPNDNLEVYLGDRWWETDLQQSSYVWYPLVNRQLVHAPLWKPDASNARGYSAPSNKTFPLSPSTTTISGNSQAVFSSCSACPSGQIATYVGDGNTFTLNSVSTPSGAAGNVWISIYYSNQDSYPDWRFGTVSVNGASAQNVTYPTGGSPNGVLQDTPVKVQLSAGSGNKLTFGARGGDSAADISHVIVWQSDQ